MVAIWDIGINEHFKLCINKDNGGFGVLCLQVVPDLPSCLHVRILIGDVIVSSI